MSATHHRKALGRLGARAGRGVTLRVPWTAEGVLRVENRVNCALLGAGEPREKAERDAFVTLSVSND